MSSANNQMLPALEDFPSELVTVELDDDRSTAIANDTEVIAKTPNLRPDWIGKVGWMAFVLLIFSYPGTVIASHQIGDRPITLEDGIWQSASVGVVSELVSREVNEKGWAADQQIWHPQARLTALPAWQIGIIDASSQWMSAYGEAADNDSDLIAAARLLAPTDDRPVSPRLRAALEAMERYDSRVEGSFASTASPQPFISASLEQIIDGAATSVEDLSAAIKDKSVWPATAGAIEAFYGVKARAFVAEQRMLGLDSLVRTLGLEDEAAHLERLDLATEMWSKAARQKPPFVMNQSGDGLFSANHLAVMAYYLGEAEDLTRTFHSALNDAAGPTSGTPLSVTATTAP